ncbi:MAG: glycosyl hydrolase family 8 [Nitrolancea sp.]
MVRTWEPDNPTNEGGRRAFSPRLPSAVELSRDAFRLATEHRKLIAHISAILTVLIVTDIFTGYNMFHYPQYELDEGTYVGAAWAMMKHGQLFYYTYTYSHPPLGWFLIGIWSTLVNGFNTFGMAINGGRVFMLVLTLISSLLVYLIVRDATRQTVAGLFASLVFAVSPLGVGLHRQVYLDNVGTVFLLLSIWLLVRGPGRLDRVVLSAVAFGLAFWSKETFAIFLPGLVFLALVQTDRSIRRFSWVLWTATALSIISLFVLLSFLKDELLPSGVLWSSSREHVSLIGTYLHQAGRAGHGSLLNQNGDAMIRFKQWQASDPILLNGGLIAAGIGLLLGYWNRFLFGISLLILTFVVFFGRGGIVLYYYIIPVLALLAITFGLVLGWLLNAVSRRRIFGFASSALLLAASVLLVQQGTSANHTNFTADRTTPQTDAAKWIVRNVPTGSTIIMDSYPWVDFRDPSFTQGKTLIAHYYWPALSDPQIRDNLLHNDWHNIDYLLISPNSTADAARSSLPLLSQAIQNSDEIASYASGSWTVKVMRVRKLQSTAAADDSLLQQSWTSFKSAMIDNGRVVDPQSNGRSTSTQQAEAMLRAVYAGDQSTFDQLWTWTESHLQRSDNQLFASQWGIGTNSSASAGVIENNTSANADETIALSLLLASKQWNSPQYLDQGQQLLKHVWESDTSVVGGRRVMVAGNWAGGGGPTHDNATINPSYFMPFAYRIFADVDSAHPWMDVVDSSYDVLERIHQSPDFGGPVGLYPDWVSLNIDNGQVAPATVNTPDVNQSSRDAARITFNLAIDWLWNHDDRAIQALDTDTFMSQVLTSSTSLVSAYNFDGSPASNNESLSMIAGTLPQVLLVGDRDLALQLFARKVVHGFDQAGGAPSWGSDPNDVRMQSAVWLSTAMMDGGLANIWNGRTVIDWSVAFYR